MAWTTEAWLREALGALKRSLDVDPRTKNEMVQFLLDEGFWDKEKLSNWDSAIAKFNSCLNPNKAEFFKIGEVWALAKRFGRHELFLAMAHDLGYEVRRVPSAERHQQLLEELATLQAQHNAHVERIGTQLQHMHAAGQGPVAGTVRTGTHPPRFSAGGEWEGAQPPAALHGCP